MRNKKPKVLRPFPESDTPGAKKIRFSFWGAIVKWDVLSLTPIHLNISHKTRIGHFKAI